MKVSHFFVIGLLRFACSSSFAPAVSHRRSRLNRSFSRRSARKVRDVVWVPTFHRRWWDKMLRYRQSNAEGLRSSISARVMAVR